MSIELRVKAKTGGVLLVALLASAMSPPESPVADAAMAGDLEAVRALVEQGADVNAAQGDGLAALHWAARNGDVGMTELLVYAGAHLEAVTRNGSYTPLHRAGQAGKASTVATLLKAGANPKAETSTGVTSLHFAAAAGAEEAVRLLMAHGADPNARETASGQTPLVFAASANRVAAVEALLAGNADPNIATKSVDVIARKHEDIELHERRNKRVAALYETELAAGGYGTNRGTDFGALQFAEKMAWSGGMTPLHHAVREGAVGAALALHAGGGDIDQVSADHSTPLLVATINGHWDLAKLLLEHGANPTIASDAGATPLYTTLNLQWAPASWTYPQPDAQRQQRISYLELMEALLEAGADPNARVTRPLWYTHYAGGNEMGTSEGGATPFWRAAYGTDVAAMKLLLEYGADPNLATLKPAAGFDMDGDAEEDEEEEDLSGLPLVPVGGPAEFPIHVASGVGHGMAGAGVVHRHVPDGWMPAVRFLVEELGVDVNTRDMNGFTPLHHAAGRGDTEMVLYLVERGADVMAVSRTGQTTADMANGPSIEVPPYPETRDLLVSLGAKNNNRCVQC